MQFFSTKTKTKIRLRLYTSKVSAGFPSPAEDYFDKKIDLNEELIKHPASTFLVQVEGSSMLGAGIISGDILVIDRALEVKSGQIVLAAIAGEFLVKRYIVKNKQVFLLPENEDYSTIEIDPQSNDFQIWGVVTFIIHKATNA